MLFLLPVEALAEYWVSIASHENRDHAEAQWRAASERSPHPFVVIGTASEEGFYFRVAAGPIQRMAEARAVLADAKADGFSEAWIWRRQDQSSLSFQNSDPSDFKTILVAVAPEGADLTPGPPRRTQTWRGGYLILSHDSRSLISPPQSLWTVTLKTRSPSL